MGLPAEDLSNKCLTKAEYFALEEKLGQKFEYVAGEVFAMAGGSITHALICKNTTTALDKAYWDKPCMVLGSDAKLQISSAESYFYPDAMVLCEAANISDSFVESPQIIFEVLSPSTEDYDHGKKFAYYRQISHLQTYVMIHQAPVLVEVYQRRKDNSWLLTEYKDINQTIRLDHTIQLSLADLYRNVTV
ncbi:MAG: Uma2 family endonuclease [bacterium]